MFDIGWTELLILAIVAILIVGPKDLPRMLYSLGQTLGKLRRSADDFRRQFNESMREAGMDEVRNDMKKMSQLNPAHQIKDEIESTFSDKPKPAGTDQPASQSAKPAGAAAPSSQGTIPPQPQAPALPESERAGISGEAAATAEHQRPEPDAGHAPMRGSAANGSAGAEHPAPAKDAVN